MCRGNEILLTLSGVSTHALVRLWYMYRICINLLFKHACKLFSADGYIGLPHLFILRRIEYIVFCFSNFGYILVHIIRSWINLWFCFWVKKLTIIQRNNYVIDVEQLECCAVAVLSANCPHIVPIDISIWRWKYWKTEKQRRELLKHGSATSGGSDEFAQSRSLARTFAARINVIATPLTALDSYQ